MTVDNSIKNLVDNDKIILWQLPQGIFDPNHTRIAVPREKGRTCWVNVFQYILHGAQSANDDVLAKVEKAVDSFRQRLNRDVYATTMRSISKYFMKHHPELGLRENAQKFIKNAGKESIHPNELELLEAFCKQNKPQGLEEFTLNQVEIEGTATYATFFKELGVSPLDFVPKPIAEVHNHNRPFTNFEQLTPTVQYSMVNIAAQRLMAQKYGFQTSSWSLSKSIDTLFQEVKEHCVIGFAGKFGRNNYNNDAHVVLKLKNRSIFGWRAEERIDHDTGHFIAVVGVKKDEPSSQTGHVIYVDPSDGSNPQDPEQQKLYIISYETFTKFVNNEFSLFPKDRRQWPMWEQGLLSECTSIKSVGFGLLPNPPYVKTQVN